MTPNKPEWFELSEADSASAGLRKINKKLPIAAIVAAASIILGGALFANANDEPSASASTSSATSTNTPDVNTAAVNPATNSVSAPTTTSAPKVSMTPVTNPEGNPGGRDHDGNFGDSEHSGDDNEGFEHDDD